MNHKMKLCGRGATTCLICNKEDPDVVFNNIGVIYGIKMLYLTDQYNIMLMSSRICIKCTGRLHQLFDFNLIKNNLEYQRTMEQNEEVSVLCEYCDGTEIMRGDFVARVQLAVNSTKWRKNEESAEVLCCFSCYNFLLLYTKIKNILDQQRPIFYLKIKSWKVIIERKIKREYDEPNVVEPMVKPILNGSETIDVGDGSEKNVVEEIDATPSLNGTHDGTESDAISVDQVPQLQNPQDVLMISSSPQQPLNATKAVEKIKSDVKRKRRTQMELSLFDLTEDFLETEDKFTRIKKRHSNNRPDPPAPPIKRKKKNLMNEEKVDEPTKKVIVLPSRIPMNPETLSLHTTLPLLPPKSSQVLKVSEILTHLESEINLQSCVLQDFDMMIIPKLENLTSNLDSTFVDADVTNEILDVDVANEVLNRDEANVVLDGDLSNEVLVEHAVEEEIDVGVERIAVNLAVNENINDNISTVAEADTMETNNNVNSKAEKVDVKSDGELLQIYRCVPLTIILNRVSQKKLDQIIKTRSVKPVVITKSGRTMIPKIRMDPSTRTNPYKIKIKKKKTDTKPMPKPKGQKERKEHKKRKEYKKRTSKIKANTTMQSNFLQLQLPEGGLPDNIEEDYVDYSSGSHEDNTSNDNINMSAQEHSSPQVSSQVEIEFLSPNFKHKGKVTIGRKVYSVVSSRKPSMRSIC